MAGRVCMKFLETWEEFEECYGFTDNQEVYTNGARLIPSFRVEQWLNRIKAKTQKVEQSNFDTKQYRADLQNAYDCGEASQESKTDILDKIKAEIEQKARLNEKGGRENGKSIRYGLCMALEIIDKYRAEREEENEVDIRNE